MNNRFAHFNDRLGQDCCRMFDIDHRSDGSNLALLLMLVEAFALLAKSQNNPDEWLRTKRLDLANALATALSGRDQTDALRYAIDTMDLVTGQAWARATHYRRKGC